ncbi:MAG: hypothetical protein ABS951_06740 [Solibacillus sp.]
MELFSTIFTNELWNILKILMPFIIIGAILGLAVRTGFNILEAILNTWLGKLVVLGTLIAFAVNFWLL